MRHFEPIFVGTTTGPNADVRITGSFSGSGLIESASYALNAANVDLDNANLDDATLQDPDLTNAKMKGTTDFDGTVDFSGVNVLGLSVPDPNTQPSIVSSDTTLIAGRSYITRNTTAPINLILPASPDNGDSIKIANMDGRQNVLSRNGSSIMGLAENMTLDIEQVSFELIYNTALGWVIFGSRAIS